MAHPRGTLFPKTLDPYIFSPTCSLFKLPQSRHGARFGSRFVRTLLFSPNYYVELLHRSGVFTVLLSLEATSFEIPSFRRCREHSKRGHSINETWHGMVGLLSHSVWAHLDAELSSSSMTPLYSERNAAAEYAVCPRVLIPNHVSPEFLVSLRPQMR